MKTENGKFFKNKLNIKINVSSIYTIHYFKYGTNFKYEGEKHNFWELVFIDSGKASITADNETIILRQGEAFLHLPNEYHNINTGDEFANSVIITFDSNSPYLKSLNGKVLKFGEYEKSLLNIIVNEAKLSYSDKLNELYLTKMTKKANAPFATEQIIKNCIELLLINLLRNSDMVSTSPIEINVSCGSDKIVESVCSILKDKQNNSSKIGLNELSCKLGFSKSYIKSQFKKMTGTTVIQYYINMKIDKAKMLLSQRKYTISEISDLLGFSSVFYFSRQFKTHTDMSPSEYINSIKADNVL